MLRKLAIFALALVALVAATLRSGPQAIAAIEPDLFCDTDDDFIPDALEWVLLTSASNPDTDGDQCSDFAEVVQGARPRQPSDPLPRDQEMRIVITGPGPGSTDPNAWLHLMVRFMGTQSSMTAFNSWLEMPGAPGVRFGFDMMSFGPSVMRQRDAGPEGTWITLSVPLVSEGLMHLLAPFSLHAESVIGGRLLHSAVSLFDIQGQISTLVAYSPATFAVQALAVPSGIGGNLSNRICLMDFHEVGSGPGGTTYEVVAARCEDCNEVECSPGCPQSVGWLVTIPGGLGTLSGN